MRPPRGSKAAGKGKAGDGSAKKAAKGGKKKDAGGAAAAAAAAAGPAASGPAVWRPGQDGIGEDEALQYDPSAYDCLHALTLEWPCLRRGARRCTSASGRLHTRFHTHADRRPALRSHLAYLATCPLQRLQCVHPPSRGRPAKPATRGACHAGQHQQPAGPGLQQVRRARLLRWNAGPCRSRVARSAAAFAPGHLLAAPAMLPGGAAPCMHRRRRAHQGLLGRALFTASALCHNHTLTLSGGGAALMCCWTPWAARAVRSRTRCCWRRARRRPRRAATALCCSS